jgi:hypothetical protein
LAEARMPPNDPTYGEVYHELLKKLREVGADALAQEIERTVARGVVQTDQETPRTAARVFTPMEDKEALAVALEFFVTASEVPLMLRSANHTMASTSIEWRPERPGTERETGASVPRADLNQQSLRSLLSKVREIAHELGITPPEIA